jgi:hypothetical protein
METQHCVVFVAVIHTHVADNTVGHSWVFFVVPI